jgi:hypothetical protein
VLIIMSITTDLKSLNCKCTQAGYCDVFGKLQTLTHIAICQSADERSQQIKEIWYRDRPCVHRLEQIDTKIQKVESKTCKTCNKKGDLVPVYKCAIHSVCTIVPWQFGQKEAVCRNCPDCHPGVSVTEALRIQGVPK